MPFRVVRRPAPAAEAEHGVQPEGYREMTELVAFYKENADILRSAFIELGFSVYGGANAPYVWVGFPGQARFSVRGLRTRATSGTPCHERHAGVV